MLLTFHKIVFCVSQSKTEISPYELFLFLVTFDKQSYQKKTISVNIIKFKDARRHLFISNNTELQLQCQGAWKIFKVDDHY